MQNRSSYILFDTSFIVKQTNDPSFELNKDVREYLYEIVGMEENILSLQEDENIEIPMVLRNDLYYDIHIKLFYQTPRAYKATLEQHSKQINQYTNTLKEINKKTLAQEINKAKRELEYVVQYDTLTGLANRSYLLKEIDNYTNKQSSFTLCLLDIDNFHTLNDEYGSHAGDMLLKHISTLLTNTFNENIFASRIFGDSFALLFNSQEHKNPLQDYIATIERKIKQNPLRYTKEDLISFECTFCFEHYSSKYANAKLFLEHLQNNMKRKKIDKKLTR